MFFSLFVRKSGDTDRKTKLLRIVTYHRRPVWIFFTFHDSWNELT